MTDPFHFINIHWIWPILIIASFIWLLYAWKEKAHYGRSKFILHLGVSLVAILSLVLIALQPQIPVKQDTQVAVLLTNEYDPAQLDSLKKINQKLEVSTYEMGEAIFDSDYLPSSVFILGHGIRSFDYWQLETIPTRYLGGKELKGVTQLNYDPDQTKGNRIQFNGTYTNPSKNNKLLLEGPDGTPLDSVILQEEKSQLFEVSTELDFIGNFKFHLVEKDSLGTVLSKDVLPLTIVEKSPLKVLVLNGFPTFESKYLKNYLAEAGHQVVVKNQLTTARYKYEYFNMTSRPIIDITTEKLDFFDLLIVDTKSLKELSNRQIRTLRSAVSELGLGILIQADDNYFSDKKPIASFQFDPEKGKNATLTAYPIQNIKKAPYQFRNNFSLQTIHGSDAKIWSAYERLGAGRVGSTVFQNTFELILNGNAKTYQSFWSELIEKISKRKTPAAQWRANRHVAYLDQPFEFALRTSIPKPSVETSSGHSIPLQRDLHVKSLWKGQVYPRDIGWKQLYLSQDSSAVFQYYVTDSSQWKSITNFHTVKDNQIRFNDTNHSPPAPRETLKPLNPLWFFLIFILCSGYLWLAPKL